MANEPDDATVAARAKYSQALQRMQELANASINNPALEPEYERAVAAVAAAEKELSK
jgi:hypothetical protein